MNNPLLEMFSNLLGQSNFAQIFNNSQNSTQNQQNGMQNNQNYNPAFDNYPKEAYASYEQNTQHTQSSLPMDNNLLPFLLSMLGNNNASLLSSLFKSVSLNKSSENKKEEESKSPPSDDILL